MYRFVEQNHANSDPLKKKNSRSANIVPSCCWRSAGSPHVCMKLQPDILCVYIYILNNKYIYVIFQLYYTLLVVLPWPSFDRLSMTPHGWSISKKKRATLWVFIRHRPRPCLFHTVMHTYIKINGICDLRCAHCQHSRHPNQYMLYSDSVSSVFCFVLHNYTHPRMCIEIFATSALHACIHMPCSFAANPCKSIYCA